MGVAGFPVVIWGGAFFFVRRRDQADRAVHAGLSAHGELAAVALAAIAAVLGRKPPGDPAIWRGFALLGILGTAAPFSLIYWGQTEISGGLASIINAATPLWTIVVAHFFTRDEKFTWRRFLGVLTGLAGVAVIMAPSVRVNWSEARCSPRARFWRRDFAMR